MLFKITECNVDIDCLPELTAEDYASFTRNDQKLIGLVVRFRTKIKTLLSGEGQSSNVVPNDVIDVKQVLLNDVRGKTINDFYRKNKKLSEEFQDLLIDVILDYHFTKTTSTIPPKNIENLSDQICKIYPNEDKVFRKRLK